MGNGRGGDDAEPALSAFGWLNIILRRRRLILLVSVFFFAAVVAVGINQPRQYVATASFFPQSRRAGGSGNLAGIAAQFGVNVPAAAADPGQSPAFYADLLLAREIGKSILDQRYEYRVDTGTARGRLIDLLPLKEQNPGRRLEQALTLLHDWTSASSVLRTGTVNLSVTTPYPALSQQIAAHYLDALNQFNLEKRQSQAAAERKFTQQRVEEAGRDLRDALSRQQQFQESNRDDRAPSLSVQRDRLQREILMKQGIFEQLSQAYEQARIEEVRDTPVLTVIDAPEVPADPKPRGLAKKGIASAFFGALLGIALALIAEYYGHASTHPTDDVSQFQALKSETWRDLRQPWRLLMRSPRRGGGGSARPPMS